MVRHYDKTATPPAERRRPKGSIVARLRFSLTGAEVEALTHLTSAWGLNDARVVGRALMDAAAREGWIPGPPPAPGEGDP